MQLTPPETLADDNVLLRRWARADVPAIVAACNDPEIARWTSVPVPYRDADARSWLQRLDRQSKDGTAAGFAVVDRASGLLAGAITLWLVQRHSAEVGYWTVSAQRRRGLTTGALRLVVGWALDEAGLARVQLGTLPGNTASERVAEKAGFRREGLLRAWTSQRGDLRDVVMWSRLRDDLPSG